MSDQPNTLPEHTAEVTDLLARFKAESARGPAQLDAALRAVTTAAAPVAATSAVAAGGSKLWIAAIAVSVGGAVAWGVRSNDDTSNPVAKHEPASVEQHVVEPPMATLRPASSAAIEDRPPVAPVVAPLPAVEPTAAPAAAERRIAKSPRAVMADEPTPAPTDDGLAAELQLLQRARAALRSDHAEHALTLLRTHRRSHPDGALVEERDATEVMALCALGRGDEARRGALEYRRRFPDSDRDVLSTCESTPDERAEDDEP